MKKRKIAIIGVGLLGGSLAYDLRKKKGLRLVGWNHRAVSRRKTLRLLPVAKSFEEAVENADVAVLCSHSKAVLEALPALLKHPHPPSLAMDVSSVKGQIAASAGRMKGAAKLFVPCHPMAGKEKSGLQWAGPGLYQGKVVFITPLKGTPAALLRKAVSFWKGVGGIPVVMNASQHDRYVALTSHLPHLLASALINLYEDHAIRDPRYRKGVGSGFRDLTRIAAGHPAMWADILALNKDAVSAFLGQYCSRLKILEKALKTRKPGQWRKYFEKTRSRREAL